MQQANIPKLEKQQKRSGARAIVDNVVLPGRWSGEDALEVGLVDELGTFIDAIEKAKVLADIEADVTPRLVYYPHRPTGLEALESLFGVSAEGAEAAIMLNRLADDKNVQSLLEQLAAAEAVNSGQTQAVIPRFRER